MFSPEPLSPVTPAPPAPVAPAPYVPVFRPDVVVTGYGYTTPINPRYCLDENSVAGLIAELKAAGLVAVEFQRDPLGKFGGGWNQSATVPWLHFADGTEVNAGAIAAAWAHGYPVSYARNLAVRSYQQCAWDQGFGPEPPSTPVTV